MLQGPLPDSVITITEIANQPSSSLSTVVDISLYNNDGSEIQPEQPIEICFDVQSDKKNACLGFYDVKTNKWTCQDDCLKQKGKSMCGKTDHFTIFAILLGGSGDSGCEDDGDFILGNAKEDGILIAVVVVSLWSCLICCVLILLYTTVGKRTLYGPEGERVKGLRKNVAGYAVTN